MDVGSLVLLTSEEHHWCTYVCQQVHLKQVYPRLVPMTLGPFLAQLTLRCALFMPRHSCWSSSLLFKAFMSTLSGEYTLVLWCLWGTFPGPLTWTKCLNADILYIKCQCLLMTHGTPPLYLRRLLDDLTISTSVSVMCKWWWWFKQSLEKCV